MTFTSFGITLRELHKSCYVGYLQIESSPRKNHSFEKEHDGFEGIALIASSFNLETFSTLNIHHHMFQVKI